MWQGKQAKIFNHKWILSLGIPLILVMPGTVLAATQYTYEQLNALAESARNQQLLAEAADGKVELPSSESDDKQNQDQESTYRKAPSLRDRAFKQLMDKLSPLTPEQIILLRKQDDKKQQAIATPPNTPPTPVSSTLTVDLSPGVTPPVIRLAAGFVTSLVFVDSSGQPWPIADYSLGNPGNFNIQWDKKTHTLFIQSTTTYSSANLAVRLSKLDTPVMLSLVSGQKQVDYRVDLQVRGRGPNALPPISDEETPATSPLLLNALDGIAPEGSQELEVSGGYGRAWLYKGKLLFRTQLTVLSPAWSRTVSSPDGTRVYEMTQTPLILASQNGKPVKVNLKGR